MRLQDLVFIIVLLATAAAVLRAVTCAVRRRWPEAGRVLVRAAAFIAAYLAVVAAAGLVTPRRWIAVGAEQRFDDWALTILRAAHAGGRYRVDVRVTNHAKGRAQRAADAGLLLVASDGREFAPLDAPAERSLQSVLQPGESFDTAREFDVPEGAAIIGLDVVHGAWPELFILGDRGSLLAKRPLVRIE